MKLSPQTKLVLDYLQSGRTLTSLIAITNLGVGSLTTRVAELRKAGFAVLDRWDTDHFERRFKKYWMDVPAREHMEAEKAKAVVDATGREANS